MTTRADATARAETVGTSGAGTRRSRRLGPRRLSFAWTGLLPFFVFVGIFFVLPIGVILFTAFRRTQRVRNPLTEQFQSRTSYTFDNLSESIDGVYRTALGNSLQLSAITAVIGAVVGVLLAYAIVSGSSSALRQVVTAAAAVLAQSGGVQLAFLFIATIGGSGLVTNFLEDHFGYSLVRDGGFSLESVEGIALIYLYFLIPLMVLVMAPAIEGLRPQWSEAAESLGAKRWHYWRYVAGPVLMPSFLGSLLLLFCSAFSAYATADALTSGSFPLVPIQIASVLSGNVLAGQENLGAALALDMVVLIIPLTVVYQYLQRRTSRWLT
jgi:putative spermidine/putrescine transport system permease protein